MWFISSGWTLSPARRMFPGSSLPLSCLNCLLLIDSKLLHWLFIWCTVSLFDTRKRLKIKLLHFNNRYSMYETKLCLCVCVCVCVCFILASTTSMAVMSTSLVSCLLLHKHRKVSKNSFWAPFKSHIHISVFFTFLLSKLSSIHEN